MFGAPRPEREHILARLPARHGAAFVGAVDDESKRLKKSWQAEEKRRARAALPMPDEQMHDLFVFVEERLSVAACDHSLRRTASWLDTRDVDADRVLAWLEDNGGYCDCEVVFNAREAWERARE